MPLLRVIWKGTFAAHNFITEIGPCPSLSISNETENFLSWLRVLRAGSLDMDKPIALSKSHACSKEGRGHDYARYRVIPWRSKAIINHIMRLTQDNHFTVLLIMLLGSGKVPTT
jgi:hypothetical protein